MAAAWHLLLEMRRPAASKYIINVNAAILLPAIRQHLILCDILTLQPENLLEVLLDQEHSLVQWMADIDDEIVSKIALLRLHVTARSFTKGPDMWDLTDRRPTSDIYSPSPARCLPIADTFGEISVERANGIWYSEDAFVEVKCIECQDVFCGGTAALRHMNRSRQCLEAYYPRPEIFRICHSLPTIALIILSGRTVARTKEDDMDGDWRLFVCACCEKIAKEKKAAEKELPEGVPNAAPPTFIGRWRQCVSCFSYCF
ncbi:hypothetical protein AAF712_015011 [Marasmius tenuissimus]|uniref:Uncharacterized protein n=1 Tax=Marasmius tenuissimus TaxID=585030 RepID=A0ABR2Z9Q9_9AGAR